MTLFGYVVTDDEDGRSAQWADLPDPAPSPDGVVVRVSAAAVAWSDVLQVEGRYAVSRHPLPFVAGHEFAGEVVSAGPDSSWLPGERVFGFLDSPGSFAEYVAAPGWSIRSTPPELSDIEAAAFTTSFLTADAALMTVGCLRAGQTVLIHAAAGGVGRAAVQLARLYGAERILATAGSEARRGVARSLGATAVAGYEDFAELVQAETRGRGCDVILESVGGDVFDQSLDQLAPLGRLVTFGASSERAPSRIKLPRLWANSISVCGVHIGRLLAARDAELEASWVRLLALLEAGSIRADVGKIVPPSHIEEGFQSLHERSVDGRVVIDLSQGVRQ